MSTTDQPTIAANREIELLADEERGTVTLVADLDEDSNAPPTEWITVETDVTVDLAQYR